ncbi:glutaredoxin domain-containing protein [Streptomyces sp. NPDC059783]|uniref:glutaredoxin domain-containing protein n=1 Tax=Streptomyces sp. NPDC059783 TaxID=3346944 RepID=UPI003664CF5B
MRRVWGVPVLYLLVGAVLAAALFAEGSTAGGVAVAVVFLVIALVHSPLFFPASTGAAEALRRGAADGRPVVFWRPGCAYCIRMRLRLGRSARRMHWVDIWSDPAGAAEVRAANDGDETVPTVFVAGRPHTNPPPAWVRGQLDASA